MKLLAFTLLLGSLSAQPVFEVASVKRSSNPRGVVGGCHGVDSHYAPNEAAAAPPLGRCVIRDGRLGHIVRIAFNLGSMQLIKGGPDWATTGEDRYNIEAKAEDPKATEEQLLQMLQALLVERFQLTFHREIKDTQGYALIVAKNGPKLKGATGEAVDFAISPMGKPAPGQTNIMTARTFSMKRLAELLTMFGPPVADRTGLTASYDFKLTWNDTDGPTLSTALQEQLGLKLESQKVPVSYVVIDSAQKPTEN